MGSIKGTASYLRFDVDGDPPAGFAEKYEQAIEARRFMPLAEQSEELEAAGWVPFEEPLDDELPITRELFQFGGLICLAYREDKMVLPRALLKHLAKRRLAELEQAGEEITRTTRRAVDAAVAAELRQKVLPRTRVVDLIWTPERREVRVFGRGPLVTERLAALFERTFALRIDLATYARRAFALDLSDRARNVLEHLQPEAVFEDHP